VLLLVIKLISSMTWNIICICRLHVKIEVCNRHGTVAKKKREAVLVHVVFCSNELVLLFSLFAYVYEL
jgi:hypothetical protein